MYKVEIYTPNDNGVIASIRFNEKNSADEYIECIVAEQCKIDKDRLKTLNKSTNGNLFLGTYSTEEIKTSNGYEFRVYRQIGSGEKEIVNEVGVRVIEEKC